MRTFILTQRIKIISELHSAFPQAFIAGKLISEPKIAGGKNRLSNRKWKAITAGTQIIMYGFQPGRVFACQLFLIQLTT